MPIGSKEFVSTFAQRSIDEAIRVRKLISELLLQTGNFSPDEDGVLLRYCVGSKVEHLPCTPPRYGSGSFQPPPLRFA